MRHLIKKLLNETVERKYRKVSDNLIPSVMKYIDILFKSFKIEYFDKSQTYGDLRIEFCLNGKEVGGFIGGDESGWDDDDDDEDEETKIGPYAGISFDKKIVSQISTTFNIRRTLVLHLLTEYFEDNFLDKVSQKFGVQFNDLDDAEEYDYKNKLCESELLKDLPNYDREEILNWIESTGRGRNSWEDKSDEELQRSFEQIWMVEKRDF